MSSPDPYSFLSVVYQNNLTERNALQLRLPMKVVKTNLKPGFCVFCNGTRELRSMLKNYDHNGKEENYTKMLLICYNIEIVGLEKRNMEVEICEVCIARLRDACSFRILVESSQELLEKTLTDNQNQDETKNIQLNPKDTTKIHSKPKRNKKKQNVKNLPKPDSEDDDFDDDSDDSNDNSNYSSNRESSPALSVHTDDDFYWNEQCNKTVKESKARAEKPDDKIPYIDPSTTKCPVCEKNFTSHYYLKNHYVTHFTTFLCDICGCVCKCKGSLSRHLALHSNRFPCDTCHKSYSSKDILTWHVKSVHNKAKSVYQCPVCGEKFKHYYLRIQHLSLEHGFEKRTFTCEACGKIYPKSSLLKQHFKNIHEKIKDHKCTQCDMEFSMKKHLKDHMVVHSDVKNFHCETCGKSYARKNTLTAHLKIHANIRAHKCDYCEKTFVQKCSLKGHMRTHTNFKGDTPMS